MNERPSFVDTFFVCLALDLVLLGFLPFLPGYCLMAMLFVVPVFAASGVSSGFGWMKQRCAGEPHSSVLARLIGGSSLLFLLLSLGFYFIGSPESGDIWGLLAYLYLNIVIFRFFGAGVFHILCGVIGVFRKGRVGKLCSFAAILNTVGAYWLLKKGDYFLIPSFITAADDGSLAMTYALLVTLFLLGFLYALCLSAVLHWVVSLNQKE